ncbi:hypothetical protein Tco_1530104 [Tanacetum coccineum]
MDTKIRRQRAEEVGYGIKDVWIDPREAVEEVASMTLGGVNARVTELTAVQEQDTQDIYAIRRLLVSREAWGRSIEAADRRSQAVTSEMLQADHKRQAEIAALQTFDHTRQKQLVQTMTLMSRLKIAPKRTTRARPALETTTTTTSVTNAQLQAMIDQGITAALAARDANRATDDSHTSGTSVRRTERVARECTYQDFMKCQPLYFKGTEGVVELTQWFERMETVFRISNCSVENQIKFSTCTLLAELKKKMADKYCPRNEMKKLEAEL